MIRVQRTEAPAFFESKHYGAIEAEVREHFSDTSSKRRQSSFDWRGLHVLQREVRADLVKMFRGKCAYCESAVDFTSTPDTEHFRPKRGARGFGEGDARSKSGAYYDTHYWWLALRWDNLLIACQHCNRFKASWFPIEDEAERAKPGTTGAALRDERPLLLDPCYDDPAEHLTFREDGAVNALSRRGQVTIELLKLNRDQLRKSRAESVRNLELSYDQGCGQIRDGVPPEVAFAFVNGVLSPESEERHLGAQRQFLSQLAASDELLTEQLKIAVRRLKARVGSAAAADRAAEAAQLAADDATDALMAALRDGELGVPTEPMPDLQPLDIGRLALERIELHNFKNIADLTVEVPQTTEEGRSPWLLFLGENAVGKSSILQAIVLTLMGGERATETGIEPMDVLRYYKHKDGTLERCDEGWVRIWVTGVEEPQELTFKQGDEEFGGNVATPSTYLLAYGSTRLFPDEDNPARTSPGRVRVRNLFKPSVPLTEADSWLFNLWQQDKERHELEDTPYNLTLRGLRRMLLMSGEHETFEPDLLAEDKRRMLVHLKNETTTIANLSDGYRTILALAADLMYMLHREGTSMSEAEGIVVIDEIGTNLHPGWKKRIVSCFRAVFPKIQFIVTTHEPLCLRGLYDRETVLLRRDYDEKIVAVTNLPNPNDLRVDELLASEFFGLSSTLESDLDEIYTEYYKLLTLRRPTKKQKERMAELKEELRDREHLGHGLRDELMYEVIDKLIADHLRSPDPKSRPQLKKEAVAKVLAAWQKAGLYDEYLPRSRDEPPSHSEP